MVTFFYNRCPNCKAILKLRLRENMLMVGSEVVSCKCGAPYRSGMYEWSHLSPKQKRYYFISDGAAGLLLMGPLIGGVFPIMDSTYAYQPFHFDWTNALWGLLGGMVCVIVLWIGKAVKIWASIRRCPVP